ncbi:rod shape-determining protein RodA [Bacteroidia bacterium]|nr:rod shape-determining protein RodA [Bacteroidia bacterium]
MPYNRRDKFMSHLDWNTILIWILLVCIGIINIYASLYNENTHGIFDLSTRSGMQALWFGIAFVIGVVVLIINARFYSAFTIIFYTAAILLMVVTLLFGKVISGSKSWLVVGPIRVQSVEFMKVATALMVAKILSKHEFTMQKFSDFFRAIAVILLPMGLAFLQKDTGSALVFVSFIIVFYRAGLRTWIVFSAVLIVALFILSLLLEQYAIIILLSLAAFILYMVIRQKSITSCFVLMGITAGIAATLYYGLPLLDITISSFNALLYAHIAIMPIVIVHALWRKIGALFVIVGLFVVSVSVCYSVDYVFDNVLKEHQRRRIADLLGMESDLKGAGYNVHQSKIAIGSGGFSGKGFLEGTQTKFNFVPEQSTDFIFCTVGEEWGFIGTFVVIGLYLILLWRVVNIAEQNKSRFARFYGYGVASILFFHIAVNLGMTVGIMPVIGIPLPFISYGGSALWAFTILLFILLKLDVVKYE